MGIEMGGRNEWAWPSPSRAGLDALDRIHHGTRRPRWQRILDRLREAVLG